MLIEWKEKGSMQRLTIEVNEIMVLVNHAWDNSSARGLSNKKGISKQRWNPLNRNILLNK